METASISTDAEMSLCDAIAAALAVLGAAFLGIGMALGENEIVLRKAVNICLECIGLG